MTDSWSGAYIYIHGDEPECDMDTACIEIERYCGANDVEKDVRADSGWRKHGKPVTMPRIMLRARGGDMIEIERIAEDIICCLNESDIDISPENIRNYLCDNGYELFDIKTEGR